MREAYRSGIQSLLFALLMGLQVCCSASRGSAAEGKGPELILPLGHTNWVWSVALSSDGKWVLTGSDDRTARLWDAETGKTLQTFQGHTHLVRSVAFGSDGKRVLTGSWDKTARLWDAEMGKTLQTFLGHTDKVTSVALSSDGKWVLTGSEDKTARLWDAETGKTLQTFQGHTELVRSVALTSDGKRVLTGSEDMTARLWDTNTGKTVQTIRVNTNEVASIALSSDGKWVLTGSEGKSARLWDAETGRILQTFQGHTRPVSSMALSGDGKRVLTGSWDRTARLWDAETGKTLQTFQGHTHKVSSMALSGDGKRMLTAPWDRTARLWDAETGRILQTFQGHTDGVTSVALSGDGKRVLTGSWDRTARLWDAVTGKTLQTFQGHTQIVRSVVLSGDGKRVLTGSFDHTARLWDADTGKTLQTFEGHTDWVTSVALSSDGKRALTGSEDRTARLCDAETGKTIQTFQGHTGSLTSVAVSGDGKRVLTGSWDRTARLWDAETGKTLQAFQGHTDGITSVASSGDGKRVLTGSQDMTARLWDAEMGKTLQTFQGHTDSVSAVAFGPSADCFVTASFDGTTSIWKPGRDRPVFSFLHAGDEWIFWTPEGYYTCSPDGEKLLAWKIHDPKAPHGCRVVGPDQFRKTFHRPDLFRHLLSELDLARALAKADRESGRPAEQPTTVARALPPTVTFIQPRRNGNTEDERLTVEAAATSVGEHPVLRMRLLLDGRPSHGNLSTFTVPSPRLGEVSRKWGVDLEPGSHTVQVVAESAVSEGRSSQLTIRRTTPTITLPRLIVLAIGISEYDSHELRKDVEYAASDAEKLARTLETRGKPLYREVKAITLLNKDATRRKILRALGQVRKEATQRDTVVIFFAGHGWRSPQNRFYFLTADTDPEDKETTALSEGDFNPAVQALLPGKVLLLLDACHSATLIENAGRSTEGPTDRLLMDLTSNEFGLVMMCSSRGMEMSLESRTLKGGHFTTAVVEGLEGKARRQYGAIYVTTLDEYVKARVQELTEGSQHPASRVPTTITDIPLTRP